MQQLLREEGVDAIAVGMCEEYLSIGSARIDRRTASGASLCVGDLPGRWDIAPI